MAPKKKNNNKKPQTASNNDDFDLDAFLEQEGVTENTPKQEAEVKPEEEKSIKIEDFDSVNDAAAAFLNSIAGPPAASGGKKKNKKKKPAAATPESTQGTEQTGEQTDATQPAAATPAPAAESGGKKKKGKKDTTPKISATALKIQAQLEAKRKAEEERLRQEEEERKRREEEERKIREEEERIQRLKEEKKRRKQEKIQQQKKDGTYLTASQKAKRAEDHVKIEMMRTMLEEQRKAAEQRAAEKKREEEEKKKREEEEKKKKEEEEKKEEEVLDDWENEEVNEEDVLDDWENEDLDEVNVAAAEVKTIIEEEKVVEKVEAKPKETKKERREREEKEKQAALQAAKEAAQREKEEKANLRSPICVIMGHVDTGKTSLLDKIRHTSVQENEAGGITQQIGATYFPIENIQKSTEKLAKQLELQYKVPGLLVIDTPGHESFSNLRSRGSNLCDIAILVVDIMHLLEPQTIESLNMLRNRNCPFIVALNKVDRLYDWKPRKNAAFRDSLKLQAEHTQDEFERRVEETITEFMKQGLNAALYYKNPDPKNIVSLVPTSAVTGEGIPDLLGLLVKLSQDYMIKRLTLTDTVKATVLEKKVIEGLGTSLDVILVNGRLRVGDRIVLCGMNGPVVTTVRALLTPQPMRELRTKTMYIKNDEVKAAMGLKVVAQDLDDAVAGTSLIVCNNDDELEDAKDTVQGELESVRKLLRVDGEGVFVQASTLGSLEALLEFLGSLDPPIPVGAFNIGPIHKRDVITASVMLEKKKEFATILAFDVKIVPEAALYAKEIGVKIFSADIIYHLFDQFTAYIKSLEDEKRAASKEEAIFPCILKIIPQYIFNRSNPIVVGVDVVEGILRPGTPLCVILKKTKEIVREKKATLEDFMPDDDEGDISFSDSKKSKTLGESIERIETVSYLQIGTVKSIELDHKELTEVRPGKSVSISIEPKDSSKPVLLGRHFDVNDLMYSQVCVLD